jgi:hypothetical protein
MVIERVLKRRRGFLPSPVGRRAGDEGRSWGRVDAQALSPTLSQRERAYLNR